MEEKEEGVGGKKENTSVEGKRAGTAPSQVLLVENDIPFSSLAR